MKTVVLFDAFLSDEAIARMEKLGKVTITRDDKRETLLAEAPEAGAFIVGPGSYITREIIAAAPHLKLIARIGVGVDRIDLQAATEHGVYVTNNPAKTADSVSEFTIAMLLGVAKNIPWGDRAVKDGNWAAGKERASTDNIELFGKTHGVIGMGEIGSRVAAVCKAFGMRVLYHKRNRNYDLERLLGVEYAPFDKLIRECDSISLHTPLTAETRNLFDKPQFDAMKKTALLINQSRGQVVNEGALLEALKAGKIGGYATDVYEDEPPNPHDEIFRLTNVLVQPHVGGASREAKVRMSMTMADAVTAVIKGEVPNNVVNKAVLK
jgi:D-3-phosphoglycerate dehydrogenase